MAVAQAVQPFELLRDIEKRSQQRALGLPQEIEVRRTWSGIGFRLKGANLLVPTSDISEIMQFPTLTRVPSAVHWVKGIANIRGTLLPVMDLGGFLEGEPTVMTKRSRVLVIRQGSVSCGLVVDEVFGMRHFFEEEKLSQLPPVSENLGRFLDGSYKQDEVQWGIFSMLGLAKHPQFLEIAAKA